MERPTSAPDDAARGHRLVGHTADLIVEAWAPDLARCCEEAVGALAESFVVGAKPAVTTAVASFVGGDDATVLLLGVLDEFLVALDTAEGVPIAAEVEPSAGGLAVTLRCARVEDVEQVGAVPKAISRHALEVQQSDRVVRCRFLVDV